MRISILVLISSLSVQLAVAGALPAQRSDKFSEACSIDKGAPHQELERRLQALDQRIWLRLTQAARNSGRLGADDLAAAAAFRDSLAALAREARRFDEHQAAPLMRKIDQLGDAVGNLERAAAGGDLAAALPRLFGRPASPVRQPADLAGVPANDDCTGALEVSPGETLIGDTTDATRDGQASCGSSLFSNDVWFKLTALSTGYFFADTFGSAFDTVLSVHTGCPGDLDNQVRCNDDVFGLQSALSFYAYQGTEYWIRLSGFDQAAGEYELHVGLGGEISGTVTSAENGDPLADGTLRVWTSEGYYAGGGSTGSAGEYAVGGLQAGAYRVSTHSFDGFFDELYDDLPCPGGSCSPTAGTPVEVQSTSAATGIDFALEEGGSLTGVVTETATGLPIPDLDVEIWNADGVQAGSATTDAAGTYLVRGLMDGNYFAIIESSVYQGEIYDDLPCLGGAPYSCDPTDGTPFVVREPGVTSGIDFALDRLGTIAGSVTEDGTGDPISDLRVEVWSLDGSFVRSGYTQTDGSYLVGGLPAGDYLVVAEAYYHGDEMYDGVPCPGGLPGGCDPADGTVIAVGLNAAVSGIDFALRALGGLSGTVTEAVTGDPIPSMRLELHRLDGSYVTSAYTDTAGDYRWDYLEPGSYAVVTDGGYYSGYVDELYDDIPCPGGYYYDCYDEEPTPVVVAFEATTAGVDFVLDRLGAVDGTVTDATSGEPVAGIEVYLVSEDGDYYDYRYTDSSGEYSFEGLPPGTYFAVTDDYYPAVYADEVYDGVPCEPGCDPEEDGTPIPVTVNTTSGIDFALTPFGRITGTVTDSVTGEPISGLEVVVYDEDGYSVEYGSTDSMGTYTVTGLMDGTYFARADGGYYGAYFDELWEETPCASGCDPVADGTPISVALGETASDIDFTLQAGGVIAGTVTDAMTGQPIPSIEVQVWREDGSFVGDGSTTSSGQFSVVGLSTGTYFARTTSYYGSTYRNEVYDDIPCSPGCSPTAGTPIAVVVGETTAGIDFALDRLGSISGFVSEAATGEGIYDAFVTVYDAAGEYAASEYINSGDYTVSGLLPGTYYVVADAFYYSSEIWDDIPCPYGCDPTVGTPIAVGLGQTISGIDFALLERGAISATVVDAADSEPIVSVGLVLWNDDGDYFTSRTTGTTGQALFDNLQAGVYYVSTRDFGADYLDELYDDVPCLYGAPSGCDPTKGTAIVVAPETTSDIDFALLYFDSGITGTVIDAAGAAIVGASVDVWDEAGNLVDSTETLVTGEYFLRLDPGSYHVSTDNGQGFVDEVHPDVPCLDGPSGDACDPQQGVAVTVTASGPQMIVTGIDFTLEASGTWIFADGFESGDLSAW